MTEFVEREEIIAKETGDLRQLSVPGECPFRTLRGDLVIVREQLCSLQTFLSQSLGPKPTLSIAPAALRTGVRGTGGSINIYTDSLLYFIQSWSQRR